MSVVTDDDIELKTDTLVSDPVATASEAAWLEYTKGTYSLTDRRIFEQGFRDGWRSRREHALQQLPQSYTGDTIYCWVCRSRHINAAKFCPAMMRI